MGDPDLSHVRSAELLTITVLRARNLRGQRGDNVNALVKVEFGEKSLGESPKVECTADTPAEFNYNASLNVTFEDPMTLDELACRPVLCTVIEVLPKEKKQKEEKTVLLGQCTVDMMQLLSGELKHKHTLIIHPLPGSPLENLPAEHPKPELDVQLAVTEPLLTENQLKEANLMNITMESLYSTPDSWTLAGPQYMFTATLPMPLSADRDNTVVFAGGQLKPGVDKEPPNKQRKWAVPGNAQGNSIYIPDKMIASDPIEDEDGDFRGKEDRELRTIAEQDKNRVTWNIERRCFIDQAATKNFQDQIAKTRYWPVEIVRTATPSGGKGKGKDDDGISFHGVAYLNLAPLLYPGVKKIRGAYKVRGFSEQELHDKTLKKGSLAEEGVRIANGILSRSSSSPFPKPGGKKDDAKGKDLKKGPQKQKSEGKDVGNIQSQNQPSAMKAVDSTSETDGPVVNAEGQQFVDSRSYIMVDITLHRPLVPKRPPEELARRVAEYIPPRPRFPKRSDGAQRSVEDFHSQVGVVANLILDEFRDKFGDALQAGELPNSAEGMDDRKQQLTYHLNSTGKYFAFKEQLKYAVVKIVREKYLKTTNFQSKEELQTFLSELYVYLIDQMHVGLNKVLNKADQSPIPEPLTDSAQLKHFAREAEVNENFDLASKYYKERIARDRNDPDHWLDYGTFCLYINDLTKAEECLKECVSIDQRHLYGLLLYGVVCTMQDKHEAAETFFEAATSFQPKSILAWTMLGLFYDGIGNEIGAEMALLESTKLNQSEAVTAAQEKKEERQAREAAAVVTAPSINQESPLQDREPSKDQGVDRKTPVGEDGLLNVETASRDGTVSVAGESTHSGKPQPPASPTSQAGSDKPSAKAGKERRNSAARKSGRLRSGENQGSRPGSVNRTRSPGPGAAAVGEGETHQEEPPQREPTPVPNHSIFMQVIEFLLEVKAMPFTERALAHHLLDPLGGPSAEYHIALARLKLQKHDMKEAEESLKEALQFDHQNPDAWAIMGHVKYLVGETETAKDCYERTLAFMADASEMHSIYLRLASIYLQEGKFSEAKTTFLMACKRSPSCVAWLGVGIACYRLGELSEAEDALSEANILNNTDPEVWAYLSLVCLKTGRQLESEQGYKYAVKLNLSDEDLLHELNRVQEEVGFGNPQL